MSNCQFPFKGRAKNQGIGANDGRELRQLSAADAQG